MGGPRRRNDARGGRGPSFWTSYKGGVCLWAVGTTSLLRLQYIIDAPPAQRDTHVDLDKIFGLGLGWASKVHAVGQQARRCGPLAPTSAVGGGGGEAGFFSEPPERHTRGPPAPTSETKRWHHTCMERHADGTTREAADGPLLDLVQGRCGWRGRRRQRSTVPRRVFKRCSRSQSLIYNSPVGDWRPSR